MQSVCVLLVATFGNYANAATPAQMSRVLQYIESLRQPPGALRDPSKREVVFSIGTTKYAVRVNTMEKSLEISVRESAVSCDVYQDLSFDGTIDGDIHVLFEAKEDPGKMSDCFDRWGVKEVMFKKTLFSSVSRGLHNQEFWQQEYDKTINTLLGFYGSPYSNAGR